MTNNKLPESVLFICYLNSIRSPIAEGLMKKHFGDKVYVESCGLEKGESDDLMIAIMKESGIDMSEHKSTSLSDLQDTLFDVVIAFTEAAGSAAQAIFEGSDTIVEIWPTPDPSQGALDVRAIMNNYRAIRSNIEQRLLRRFETPESGSGSASENGPEAVA